MLVGLAVPLGAKCFFFFHLVSNEKDQLGVLGRFYMST